MKIKVISLWQPWATLIALGHKRIETRSWPTHHRGQIAIHAARKWDRDLHGMCCREPFSSSLGYASVGKSPTYLDSGVMKPLPFGAIVATANLVDCLPTEWVSLRRSPAERAFGDFTPGRWAWLLQDVRMLQTPIPLKGHQGLFEAEMPPVPFP